MFRKIVDGYYRFRDFIENNQSDVVRVGARILGLVCIGIGIVYLVLCWRQYQVL